MIQEPCDIKTTLVYLIGVAVPLGLTIVACEIVLPMYPMPALNFGLAKIALYMVGTPGSMAIATYIGDWYRRRSEDQSPPPRPGARKRPATSFWTNLHGGVA